MTTSKRLFLLGSAMLLSVASGGCIVIGGGGAIWCWGTTIWTEAATEQLSLDTTGLESLEIRTHNGAIEFNGQPAETAEASVTVTKTTGGHSPSDAEAAMEALEVFVEPSGPGTQLIGWRWKGVKNPSWQASVSFAITAPGQLDLDVETHNGRVGVEGVVGDVGIVTHNGRITVSSEQGRLSAETHNGRIRADYAGGDLTLLSHNGRINADLQRCGSVRGDITTHNGSVEVAVGENTSAAIRCDTHNGRIDLDAPIAPTTLSNRRIEGKLGGGGDTLAISTHNGSIAIKKAAG